jgi:hypothetical protein
MGFYDRVPGYTTAYHNDGTHEYFGKAPKGMNTSDSAWQIFKMEYDTSYSTAGDPWIIKWPNGDDSPKYIWDNVGTYSYYILGRTS